MDSNKAARYKKLAIGTAVVLVALLYFFIDARSHAFPKCPFYSFTHFYCPGCGSQRALSAILHGKIGDAFHDNVLMVLFLPLLCYWFFTSILLKETRALTIFYNPVFGRVVLIAVVGFWLLRNIPAYPFSILAPLN